MARRKKSDTTFQIREVDLQEAQREFSRKRGRGSKYDAVLDSAEKLDKGKALIIEQVSYSEVTAVRNRVKEYLKGDYKIEATKVKKGNGKDLYDMLIHREK